MKEIETWNERLMGMPSGVLVLLACVAFGYVLRVTKIFPNRGIPLAVVMAGAMLFALVTPPSDGMLVRTWLVRNLMIGSVIGFAAWVGHNRILARFEDRIPVLRGLLDRGADGQQDNLLATTPAQRKESSEEGSKS